MRASLRFSFDIPRAESSARQVMELNSTSKTIACFIAAPGKRAAISAAEESAAVHAAVMEDDLTRAKTEWFPERAGRAAIAFFGASVLGHHDVRLFFIHKFRRKLFTNVHSKIHFSLTC